jgi:glycosyltransferase involved in cell wall biosynthesis
MNKRIKVLFTISNFNTAGSGKVVYDLVKGLDKTKFDIHIACGDAKGAFFKEVEDLGLPIHIFETKIPFRPYYTLLIRVRPISKFYKNHGFDIVHSWQWSNDWTEALAARLIGIKWIYTKKAMGFNKHWKIKSFLANFIVTINDEMRNYFPNKKNQELIPLGIDTEYYKPKRANELSNSDNSNFNIITVANLVPVKGIEVLIQALYKLEDNTVKLTVLGDCDNAYGTSMKALTQDYGLENQIEFLGKQLDVRPFINSSDLYVIPTLDEGRKEGMPMALVEAMSMAIPVLGSDITGINFVLKNFSELLFTAADVDALASKIKQMISMDKGKREAIGQQLRVYCKTNFTMKAFISKHEILYQNVFYGI